MKVNFQIASVLTHFYFSSLKGCYKCRQYNTNLDYLEHKRNLLTYRTESPGVADSSVSCFCFLSMLPSF